MESLSPKQKEKCILSHKKKSKAPGLTKFSDSTITSLLLVIFRIVYLCASFRVISCSFKHHMVTCYPMSDWKIRTHLFLIFSSYPFSQNCIACPVLSQWQSRGLDLLWLPQSWTNQDPPCRGAREVQLHPGAWRSQGSEEEIRGWRSTSRICC